MSYILDALNKSDRDRQIGQVHTLPVHVYDEDKSNKWLWYALGLFVALLLVVFMYFLISKKTDTETAIISQQESTKALVDNSIVVQASTNESVQASEILAQDEPNAASDLPDSSQQLDNDKQTNTAIPVESQRRLDSFLSANQTSPISVSSVNNGAEIEERVEESSSLEIQPADQVSENSVSSTDIQNYRSVRSQLSNLGSLHLDILAYHPEANERKAFINMKKYQEGDVIAEGATIQAIKQQGVVMTYQGTEFILTAK